MTDSEHEATPFRQGYERDIRDAREVLSLGPDRTSWSRTGVSPIPAELAYRAEWLDGYTLDMRRIVLNARLGKPWQAPDPGLAARGGGDHDGQRAGG